jgi:hypothetical protein
MTSVRFVNHDAFFPATGGAASFVVGCVLLGAGSSAGGLPLVVLGVFLWALAGAGGRIRRLALNLVGAKLEAELADKKHGDEFAEAAKEAPDSVLEAVIPLLREDVASDVIEVGPSFDGKRLVDPELAWLRQELNVTVFALNRPGDGERWTGGGRISEIQLPAGSRLAVLGERPDILSAESRLAV